STPLCRSNAFGRAGARHNDRAVADADVLIGSDLPGDDAALADLGAAGKACERSHNGLFADLNVVAELDQVVELRAAPDARFAEARAVYATICAEFHLVFDDDASDLQELELAALLVGREAETV